MSQNWAICVGINRYVNLQPLEYAERDAEALRDFFNSETGFQSVYHFAENAPPIVGSSAVPISATPTFGSLMRFLRIRFDEPFLKASDNFWFFFAGHGMREGNEDFLLPSDADPGNVTKTAIPVRYVCEQLRRSGADNVILLLDACRNEGARDGQGIGLERQKGVVTLCSCSPAERSYEIGELKHGAFTYGLLEALRLQGKHNCATVERLDDYLRYRVPEICTQYKRPRQTPYTFVEPIAKRHLILLPDMALPEDLEPIKLDALNAEAEDDLALAEQLWWRVNAVSPTDSQAHEAIKRVARKIARGSHSEQSGQPVGETVVPAVASAPMGSALKAQPPVIGATPFDDKSSTSTVTRRQLLLLGAGSVALGTTAGAWYISRKPPFPAIRTEQFKTVTVNSIGELGNWQSRTAKFFTESLSTDSGLELAVIPSGQYLMGSPENEPKRRQCEGPQHMVDIRSFAIGRTTITQAQWRAVLMARPDRILRDLPFDPSSFEGDDLPAETISWQQASEFCDRLSDLSGRIYRLPSEAEWEYACRAQTSTPFHFGPTITPELANYCGTGNGVCGVSNGKDISNLSYGKIVYGNGGYDLGPSGEFTGKTMPVRTFPANGFGLYEMHGNVWEYCLDTWQETYPSTASQGEPYVDGDQRWRVLRGGSWSHNPAVCRSAYREPMDANYVGWQGRVGFRVVCEL
jgi:formylglycine-generating enzyme required for sulfatase activity/uncharacterized caspase-like protein